MSLMTIYSVQYSEATGFYVDVYENVERDASGNWREVLTREGRTFEYDEGWRETEDEAVRFWRDDGILHAENLHAVADELMQVATKRTPTIPTDKIMKPKIP